MHHVTTGAVCSARGPHTHTHATHTHTTRVDSSLRNLRAHSTTSDPRHAVR